MTRDEKNMERWERMLNEGADPFDIFGTSDLRMLKEYFHDVMIVRAFRRCEYFISKTAKFLNIRSRNTIQEVVDRYIPNHRELRKEAVAERRRRAYRIKKLKEEYML